MDSPQSSQNTAGHCASFSAFLPGRPPEDPSFPERRPSRGGRARLGRVLLPHGRPAVSQPPTHRPATWSPGDRRRAPRSGRWVCGSLPCRLGSVSPLLCPPFPSRCPRAVRDPVPRGGSAERAQPRPQEVAVETEVTRRETRVPQRLREHLHGSGRAAAPGQGCRGVGPHFVFLQRYVSPASLSVWPGPGRPPQFRQRTGDAACREKPARELRSCRLRLPAAPPAGAHRRIHPGDSGAVAPHQTSEGAAWTLRFPGRPRARGTPALTLPPGAASAWCPSSQPRFPPTESTVSFR